MWLYKDGKTKVIKMLFSVSIFLSLLSFAACADVRVIGGNNAPEGKYPYVAFLVLESDTCTGSILNNRWILTSAYCIEGSAHDSVLVVLNTTAPGGPHSDYYKSVYLVSNSLAYIHQHDIGMVKVEREIEFSEKVQPVALPTEDFRKVDHPAVFTGWDGSSSRIKTLQQIQLKVISSEKCKRSLPLVPVTSSHICTLNRIGEGACRGDSGGPLVANGVQIGVASFVFWDCGTGYPDVFTRVYTFLDWIKAEQEKHEGIESHPQNFVFYLLSFVFRAYFLD